jgi:hypothetical protein
MAQNCAVEGIHAQIMPQKAVAPPEDATMCDRGAPIVATWIAP